MHKYFAKPVLIDGIRFASTKESQVYQVLKLQEAAGTLTDLEIQPVYPVVVNGVTVCRYIADFRFFDTTSRQTRVLDVKGIDTPVSKLKRKLVHALYGLNVEIV